MSFSLAKKNIKHKRKTMKRKQKGGGGEGEAKSGRFTFTNPFKSFGSKKEPIFNDLNQVDKVDKVEKAKLEKAKSDGTKPDGVQLIDPPIEKREGKKKEKSLSTFNRLDDGAESVGKNVARNTANARANKDQTTASSETALVATLAAAIHQLPCDTTYESIRNQLAKKNIKSISKKEKKRLTSLGTVTFDANSSVVEKGATMIKLIKNISFAMETIKSVLPPGTTGIIGIAENVGVAASKYNQHLELLYLSAQCLIYISNISRDLAEIHSFYNNAHVIDKNITIDQSLYEILVKSLFTFTYFLIDNIDFTSKISGIDQYKFWYAFLSRIDFSNTEATRKGCIYKYSCQECIPKELRAKLRELSISGKPYKRIIDFDDVFDTTVPKKKSGFMSFASGTANIAAKLGTSITNASASMISKSTDKSVIDSNIKLPDKGLFGFCSEDIVTQCKNYNDIIMRLIEFNIYKLFKTTYKNQNFLPIKFEDKGSGINSDDFYKYIFENIKLRIYENTDSYKHTKKNDETEGNNDETEGKKHKTYKTEDYDRPKYDDDDKVKELLKPWLVKTTYSSEEELEELMCFEFLFELKRIINELDAANMLTTYKAKFKPKPNSNTIFSKRLDSLSKGSKMAISIGSAYFGNPETKYKTFLREYVIMTGNFATILSRYSLDHNKLTPKDKEVVLSEVNQVINKFNRQLTTATSSIANAATTALDAGKNLEEILAANRTGEPEGAAGPEGAAVSGGKLIHNRLKKHTKKYKHYNDYNHYKSKKIRRYKRK